MAFDTSHDSQLDFKELLNGIESLGLRLNEKEAKKLFDELDSDKNGFIKYEEFCKLFENKIEKIYIKAEEEAEKSLSVERESRKRLIQRGDKPAFSILPPNEPSELNLKFRDSLIRKNVDPSSFQRDIEE
jgi:hypothetical protein